MNAPHAFMGRARALPAPPAVPSGLLSARLASLPLLVLVIADVAAGQVAEPKGPADIIGGAQRSRATRELKQAGQRAQATGTEAPPVQAAGSGAGSQAAPSPHPAAGHPGLGKSGAAEPPQIATGHEDTALAAGTIRVRVFDRGERPAADAEVNIGVMASDGGRSSVAGRTGADGVVTFSGLGVGEQQAYRVNVPYQGAKYSSTPFRLPMSGGYQVEIRRAPVTRNARMVVLYVGATSLELKDERIKIVQQTRLVNLGGETYVFPEKGTLVRLPKGFLAMQSEQTMGDQRIEEAAGEGLRVLGSLPPGEATLLWGFDLPIEGTEARFTVELPWLTFAYRVIADAPVGLSLAVEGMPEPVAHEDGGRRFLVTEVQRRVGDEPFKRVQITLRGIPGPGPGRFIAAALAVLLIAAGAVVALRQKPNTAAANAQDLERRKQELLARAKKVAAEHATGETGPQYHDEQLRALTDELAGLLLEEQRAHEQAQRV